MNCFASISWTVSPLILSRWAAGSSKALKGMAIFGTPGTPTMFTYGCFVE